MRSHDLPLVAGDRRRSRVQCSKARSYCFFAGLPTSSPRAWFDRHPHWTVATMILENAKAPPAPARIVAKQQGARLPLRRHRRAQRRHLIVHQRAVSRQGMRGVRPMGSPAGRGRTKAIAWSSERNRRMPLGVSEYLGCVASTSRQLPRTPVAAVHGMLRPHSLAARVKHNRVVRQMSDVGAPRATEEFLKCCWQPYASSALVPSIPHRSCRERFWECSCQQPVPCSAARHPRGSPYPAARAALEAELRQEGLVVTRCRGRRLRAARARRR